MESATTLPWKPHWPPGCARVNLGTAAIEDPQWCARALAKYGDKIAVGLDVRLSSTVGTAPVVAGWVTDGGDLWETLARLDRDGCTRYVVTDVSKDGTLTGPKSRTSQPGLRGHRRARRRLRWCVDHRGSTRHFQPG